MNLLLDLLLLLVVAAVPLPSPTVSIAVPATTVPAEPVSTVIQPLTMEDPR